MIGTILLFLLLTVVLLLTVALLIPAYIRVSYKQGKFCVNVKYAWLTIPIFPSVKEFAEEKPGETPPAGEQKEKPSKQKPKVNREQIRYTLNVLPSVLLRALRRTGRRVRIEPLKVHVLIATPDPADTAVLYGKIHAALAATLPIFHHIVKIKEQDIQLFSDFCGENMDYIVDAGIGIRPGDLLVIALFALGGVLKWYKGFKKLASKMPQTIDAAAKAETAA